MPANNGGTEVVELDALLALTAVDLSVATTSVSLNWFGDVRQVTLQAENCTFNAESMIGLPSRHENMGR